MTRKALGKGLGALIGKQAIADPVPNPTLGERVENLSIHLIEPSALQPRKTFDETKLDELAESIRSRGIIEPLIVRRSGSKYELIAGERRWRASQKVGLKEVKAIVREATDREVLELALIENLQRADLNPIEQAHGFAELIKRYDLTQEELAKQLGKTRVAVANTVRLLDLVEDGQKLLAHGQITAGHGRALLGLTDRDRQRAALQEVVQRGLSVRQTEALVQDWNEGTKKRTPNTSKKNGASADWRELELRLQRSLGTKVRLIGNNQKGRLEIQYFNGNDLERILEKFGVSGE